MLHEYSRPYTLRTTQLKDKEIPLVEIIKGFNNDMSEHLKRYNDIFKAHLRKEKHFMGSFSMSMKQILEEEVKLQTPMLDFDNDPVAVEICLELQKFDKLSYGNLCNILKDRIDMWTSEKLSKIRLVVDRCYQHEKWKVDPNSEFFHSHSVEDLFKILFYTFDKLFDVIGEKFFKRWHATMKAMIDDVMFDYCSRLLDDIGDVYKFKKLIYLPKLKVNQRKLTWPMQISQRFKGKKHKVIFGEFYDEKFEIESI